MFVRKFHQAINSSFRSQQVSISVCWFTNSTATKNSLFYILYILTLSCCYLHFPEYCHLQGAYISMAKIYSNVLATLCQLPEDFAYAAKCRIILILKYTTYRTVSLLVQREYVLQFAMHEMYSMKLISVHCY
jgi:hypothetical protein